MTRTIRSVSFAGVATDSGRGDSDSNDHIAPFSSSIAFSRGEEPDKPDVVASGVNVISAKPIDGVQSMSGTSMATPHVAGTIAMLVQAYPKATVQQIEQAVERTCKELGPPKPYGYGLVVPVKALAQLKGTMSA